MPKRRIALAFAFALLCSVTSAMPARAEHGVLLLHFLGQHVGEESYDLTRAPDGTIGLQSHFAYTERGSTVPLTATLKMRPDFSPIEFRSVGRSYRPFSVDASVAVAADGRTAVVSDGGPSQTVPVPKLYFTSSGYNPLSVQTMLLRYWVGHGRPQRLAQLPAPADAAPVEIREAGRDRILVAGRPVWLTRYTVRNVVWGSESIWLDPAREIAAATTYAGGLPIEAVRPDYAAALPQLVRVAQADRLGELEKLGADIRPVTAGRFAIVGARLIDGRRDVPVEDATVLVDEGRIVAVGARGQVPVPNGVAVIDAHGRTLLPGLWEMHAHFAQVDYGPAYLAAGVTTARDLGGEFDFLTRLRDVLNGGRGLGPELLLACLVDGSGPGAFGTVYADTPEQGRAIVGRCKAAGFVQMKIYDRIKPDVLAAITAEAHRLGLTVTGHVPHGMTAQAGVLAGMDMINHFGPIMQAARGADPAAPLQVDAPAAQAAIGFFRAHGTVIDPTLAWGELLGRPRSVDIAAFEPGFAKAPYTLTSVIGSSGSPPSDKRNWGLPPDTAAMLLALFRAGVPIVAGTDKALPAHSLHRELELYVKAGIPPLDVIKLATSGAARVMGMDKEVGTIEPGKRADMVLVDGDPLQDFSALRRVVRVVTAGRMYDPVPLWRSVGFRP